jgi:hypothetical protein
MKIKVFLICISLSIISLRYSEKLFAQNVNLSFQVFYDELSPYGTWINNDDYGYVWLPNVDNGFQPYSTNGYWIYTDMGWTWVSNYPWGWAPFHYGRWYYDSEYGAMWIPDNEWGPGWVNWRHSDDYFGWSPMGPGMSYGNNYISVYNHWTFVHSNDFGKKNIYHYYTKPNENVTIILNTTIINNPRIDNVHHVNYHGGPDKSEVEKRLGGKIESVEIKSNDKPGENIENNQLHIYNPNIKKNSAESVKPEPKKVSNRKDLKPAINNSPEKPVDRIEPKPIHEINTQKQPKEVIKPQHQNKENQNTNQQKNPEHLQTPSSHSKVPPSSVKTPVIQPQPSQPRNNPIHQNTPLLQQTPPRQNNPPAPSKNPVPHNRRNTNQPSKRSIK